MQWAKDTNEEATKTSSPGGFQRPQGWGKATRDAQRSDARESDPARLTKRLVSYVRDVTEAEQKALETGLRGEAGFQWDTPARDAVKAIKMHMHDGSLALRKGQDFIKDGRLHPMPDDIGVGEAAMEVVLSELTGVQEKLSVVVAACEGQVCNLERDLIGPLMVVLKNGWYSIKDLGSRFRTLSSKEWLPVLKSTYAYRSSLTKGLEQCVKLLKHVVGGVARLALASEPAVLVDRKVSDAVDFYVTSMQKIRDGFHKMNDKSRRGKPSRGPKAPKGPFKKAEL